MAANRQRNVAAKKGYKDMIKFTISRAARLFALGISVALLVVVWRADPVLGQDKKPLTEAQIEQLVAPIALYPDPLISQILMASTYPLEVVEAERWAKANPNVKGDDLKAAMEKQNWDPSVKSLTTFPDVLKMMSDKLSWTQQLGDAFLAQQKDVLGAIQNLRARADKAGNLKTSKELKVEKKTVPTTSGTNEQVIIIEQTNPEVIYVPAYNPTVIYGPWPYPAYPPVTWYPPGYVASSAFWFASGVVVGGALWGSFNWGRRDVNININRYNSYNRTTINNNRWTHNSVHRRGVPYRNRNVANRYGRGRNQARERARDQYRGRAAKDRQNLGSTKRGNPRTGNPRTGNPRTGNPRTGNPRTGNQRTGNPRTGNPRTGSPRTGNPRTGNPNTGNRGATRNRPGTTRSGTAPRTGNTGRTSTTRRGRQPDAFRNMGSGKQVRQNSARGRSSRGSARSHGGGNRGGGGRGGGRRR